MSKKRKKQNKSIKRLEEKARKRQATIDKERIDNFIELFGNVAFDYDGYKFGWLSADGNYHLLSAHTLENKAIQNGRLADAFSNSFVVPIG